MAVYDVTGQTEVKVGQLVAVARSDHNGSPYMDIGVVTRFTPKRVYYETFHGTWAQPYNLKKSENWTPKDTEQRYEYNTSTYKHSTDQYTRLLVLYDKADIGTVENILRTKWAKVNWKDGRA